MSEPQPAQMPARTRWIESPGALITVLNLIIAGGTLLVTYFGLSSISRQIEQTQATMLADASEKIYSRMHDIHRLFIENPELRPYFYDGVENRREDSAEGEARYQRVVQASELLVDFFHQIIITLDSVPEADRTYRGEMYQDLRYGWTCYIKDVFKQSPALRSFYLANKPWYTSNRLATDIFDAAEQERVGGRIVAEECRRLSTAPGEDPVATVRTQAPGFRISAVGASSLTGSSPAG